MRKIFLSSIKLKYDLPEERSIFRSRDFDLGGADHFAPICYLLDANIESGDKIVIITGVMQTDQPLKNYELMKQDMESILSSHQAQAEFIVIDELNPKESREEMDSLTFSKLLKQVADYFQDGDIIFADMTFGLKFNTIASFIALLYAEKSLKNVQIKRIVYSERYSGDKEKEAMNRPTSDIIDITSLFHIASILSNAKCGQKQKMDKFLDLMIG